ncbi:MAG TPA: peptidylprolyl isomerase [Burkholderiaceae bacterium]|nr:peptidylprolyl isomerase [Burkholderiaceae bacterium]
MNTSPLFRLAAFAALSGAALASAAQTPTAPALRPGDWITAVVNQEVVTAFEVAQRMNTARAEAQRNRQRLPDEAELRKLILESLIEDRAILSHARDSGVRVDEAEIDRAVQVVAAQNQVTLPQLRARLAREGVEMARFRANLKDQMMIERVRESEVARRIRITDGEIDAFIDKERGAAATEVQYNIAQVLIRVPDGASDAVVAERRARADAAFARIRGGEAFEAVARAVSEDEARERGGEMGMRAADRIPDLFLEAVRPLKNGELAPAIIRSGAGFHVLKLVERSEGGAFRVTQTRARHILLRPTEQLNEAAIRSRLAEFKRQIAAGTRRFEDLAREHSLDGSAQSGGELGWASPGQYVPEFEQAMNALPLGGVSDPVNTRFGWHLIQVSERRSVALDTKQLREQARAALRERKFEEAYADWLREVRGRAYVELREPPQ